MQLIKTIIETAMVMVAILAICFFGVVVFALFAVVAWLCTFLGYLGLFVFILASFLLSGGILYLLENYNPLELRQVIYDSLQRQDFL